MWCVRVCASERARMFVCLSSTLVPPFAIVNCTAILIQSIRDCYRCCNTISSNHHHTHWKTNNKKHTITFIVWCIFFALSRCNHHSVIASFLVCFICSIRSLFFLLLASREIEQISGDHSRYFRLQQWYEPPWPTTFSSNIRFSPSDLAFRVIKVPIMASVANSIHHSVILLINIYLDWIKSTVYMHNCNIDSHVSCVCDCWFVQIRCTSELPMHIKNINWIKRATNFSISSHLFACAYIECMLVPLVIISIIVSWWLRSRCVLKKLVSHISSHNWHDS